MNTRFSRQRILSDSIFYGAVLSFFVAVAWMQLHGHPQDVPRTKVVTNSVASSKAPPPPPPVLLQSRFSIFFKGSNQNSQASYAMQAAENSRDIVIQDVEALLCDNFRQYQEPYVGLHKFWSNGISVQIIENTVNLLAKYSPYCKALVLFLFAFFVLWSARAHSNRIWKLSFVLFGVMFFAGFLFNCDDLCEFAHRSFATAFYPLLDDLDFGDTPGWKEQCRKYHRH